MSLERVLEPEIMDTVPGAEEYDRMDHAAVNAAFADRAMELLPERGTVLDVGTGTARIPLLLAGQAPGLKIVAIDLAQSMLDIARRHVSAASLEASIELVCMDAKRLDFPDAHFAAVVSNSIVHHIPRPAAVFAEIRRVAEPGAALLIRDLLRPDSERELDDRVDRYAADCTPYQRKLFSDSLRASLRVEEVQALVKAAGLSEVIVVQSSDRHWTAERPVG